MKILGIDTATKYLSIGIFDGQKAYEYNVELGPKLSALLIPVIGRVLDAAGLSLEKIDYLACGLGPGSFTGMRVGLAAIKGLSWAAKKPVIGISTLDILAQGIEIEGAPIMPIIDAKRKLIYTATFIKRKAKLARQRPCQLVPEKEMLSKVACGSVILGDALNLYKETIFKNKKNVVFADRDYWYPKGHNIINLALERIKKGALSNAFNIKPIYLYPKECQIKK